MIENAHVTIVNSEITISAVYNGDNSFTISLSQGDIALAKETFTPAEFSEFVNDFASKFSVGQATVEIRNRPTFIGYRRHLRAVWGHYERSEHAVRI